MMRKRTVPILSQKLRGLLKVTKKFSRGESGGDEIALFFSLEMPVENLWRIRRIFFLGFRNACPEFLGEIMAPFFFVEYYVIQIFFSLI